MFISKVFKLLVEMAERFRYSKEQQARRAGVSMGESNFIYSSFWSSEPYLIKVGSHCQITAGVRFFTHGGAEPYATSTPTSTASVGWR